MQCTVQQNIEQRRVRIINTQLDNFGDRSAGMRSPHRPHFIHPQSVILNAENPKDYAEKQYQKEK